MTTKHVESTAGIVFTYEVLKIRVFVNIRGNLMIDPAPHTTTTTHSLPLVQSTPHATAHWASRFHCA